MNKTLMFILFIFLLIPVALAQPVTEIFTPIDSGVIVEYTPIHVLKQSEDWTFNFHIFNVTTGHLLHEGFSCEFNLYNSTGIEMIDLVQNGEDDPSMNHFEFFVGADNFSYVGQYAFAVFCNNSHIGGFIASSLDVTATGILEKEGASALGFVILIPLFVMLALLFIAWMLPPEKYWALKLALPIISLFFVFQAYEYAVVIIAEVTNSIVLIDAIGLNIEVVWYVMYIIISIMLITFIRDIFMMFSKKKHRTGEDIDEDG